MKVIREYGVVHPTGIMAKGVYFLVDKRGVVQGRWFGKAGEVAPSEPMLTAAQKIAGKM